jgi:mRNA interferase MazF
VPFPLTSETTAKRRPALIVSPGEFNAGENVIILQISAKKDPLNEDYEIKEWELAQLPVVSYIKMKFATIKKEIISKKIGKLSDKDVKVFKNYL